MFYSLITTLKYNSFIYEKITDIEGKKKLQYLDVDFISVEKPYNCESSIENYPSSRLYVKI